METVETIDEARAFFAEHQAVFEIGHSLYEKRLGKLF